MHFMQVGRKHGLHLILRKMYGARSNSWFSHISIEVPGVDGSTEWLEKVEY